jgi:HNH endonuclease
MAISEADTKLLWGRAAGMCSRPGCNEDLTRLVDGGKSYHLGEMAHVIAQSPKGPRGDGIGGGDSYDNLILLCPTCHRDVDKAPENSFTETTIRQWKGLHEDGIRRLGFETHFATLAELKLSVARLLAENYQIWKTLGPRSEVAERTPGSNGHGLWELRRIDKILPNNRRIINMIRANDTLLDRESANAFAEFVNHAECYEDHVYDRRDSYPQFPGSFGSKFG